VEHDDPRILGRRAEERFDLADEDVVDGVALLGPGELRYGDQAALLYA
jgi:hypothetical protein